MIDLTEAEISQRLARALRETREANYTEYPTLRELLNIPPKPAAVLIPLLRNDNLWHLLFIRRTEDLHEHSDQVAFPGGRDEPEDVTPQQTALREAGEEIGLKLDDIRILGQLRDFLTITNYRVTPVVGRIPWPYPLRLAPKEVRRAFTIPLDWLADPENHEERLRALPPPFTPIPVVYFRPYEGEVLWGASARFTLALLEILNPILSTTHPESVDM